MIGILAHDGLQTPIRQELVFLRTQMQNNLGAVLFFGHGFQGVIALARRLPTNPVLGTQAGSARNQGDFIRHNKRGVETHAELPDQMRVLGLVSGKAIHEFARAGTGDGPDVLDHFIARHTDAVIRDSDGARFLVGADTDF